MASRPPGHCSQAATDRVGGLRSSVKVPSVVMSHTTGWRFGLTLGLPCAPVRLRLLGHRMWTLRETSDGFTCNLAVSRRRGLRSGEGYRLAPGGSCALFLNRFCLSSSRINYMASLPPPSHRPPPHTTTFSDLLGTSRDCTCHAAPTPADGRQCSPHAAAPTSGNSRECWLPEGASHPSASLGDKTKGFLHHLLLRFADLLEGLTEFGETLHFLLPEETGKCLFVVKQIGKGTHTDSQVKKSAGRGLAGS